MTRSGTLARRRSFYFTIFYSISLRLFLPRKVFTVPLSILLCPSSGALFDKIVQAAESGNPIIHVALDLGTGIACEDVWPMLRLVPANRYGTSVRRVPLTILSAEQEQAITAYLMARVGTARYDLFQLPLDLAGDLTHHWIDSPWHSTRAVCSSVIMEALAAVGIAPFAPRDPATLQPSDVAAWCDAGLPALLTGATAAVVTVPVTTEPPVVPVPGLA